MKPYLVTATGHDGRRETFARDAASLEHLRAVLEREGFRDIEFVDDEFSAELRQMRPETGKPKSQAEYRLEASLRRGPNPLGTWLTAIRGNWMIFAAALVAALYGIWSQHWGWTIAAVVVVALWCFFLHKGLQRAASYNEVLRACACGESQRAQALIKTLESSSAVQGNVMLQSDLCFRRAIFMAREGKLDEALALVEPWREALSNAKGLFDSRIASVYCASGDIATFLRHMALACEESGQGQLQRLDLAFANARVGSVAQARDLIAGLERQNLSALHMPIIIASEGLCDQREGNTASSLDSLTRAHDGFSAFSANPAVWPILGMIAGHLAIALARSGRREDARKTLDRWRPVAMTSLDASSLRIIETEVLE